MAIDTRNRRMALIGLGSPVPRVLPHPDGAFNTANDRYMLVFLYPVFGDTPTPPIPPTPSDGGGGASYGGPGQGESGRGYYVDWSLPRRRWIDREDEELLIIILDDDGY